MAVKLWHIRHFIDIQYEPREELHRLQEMDSKVESTPSRCLYSDRAFYKWSGSAPHALFLFLIFLYIRFHFFSLSPLLCICIVFFLSPFPLSFYSPLFYAAPSIEISSSMSLLFSSLLFSFLLFSSLLISSLLFSSSPLLFSSSPLFSSLLFSSLLFSSLLFSLCLMSFSYCSRSLLLVISFLCLTPCFPS